jgi:hypothetical protein
LNVKGRGWKGQTAQDSRGHAVFADPAYGVRAAIVLLRTYWFTHRLRTIAAILSRWAPASDTVGSLPGAQANSPREYSLFVSRRMGGFPATKSLSLFKPDRRLDDVNQLKGLVEAMTTYEIGGGFDLPDHWFERALYLV